MLIHMNCCWLCESECDTIILREVFNYSKRVKVWSFAVLQCNKVVNLSNRSISFIFGPLQDDLGHSSNNAHVWFPMFWMQLVDHDRILMGCVKNREWIARPLQHQNIKGQPSKWFSRFLITDAWPHSCCQHKVAECPFFRAFTFFKILVRHLCTRNPGFQSLSHSFPLQWLKT